MSLKLTIAKAPIGQGRAIARNYVSTPLIKAPKASLPAPPQPESKQGVLLSGSDYFVFDFLDKEVEYSDVGSTNWEEIPRTRGFRPWLVDTGGRLRKLKFKATLYKGGQPVDDAMDQLFFMSSRPDVQTISYGKFETGTYRLTELSFTTITREAGTNNITHATCEFTLTQASDPPKSKPVPAAPAPAVVVPASAPTDPPKATYVVKRGDTLWNLAVKYYKNGSAYGRIADANGIKDVRNLKVGQTLVIP